MVTTGWKSLSAPTLRARTWSWWRTAQTYMSVSTPATSPLQMSWRATGCCTNTPITGDASTSCVLGSTGGTASGGAPALPLVLWDGSPSLTDSHLYFLLSPSLFFFFEASLLLTAKLPTLLLHFTVWTLSQHCGVQTWNHTLTRFCGLLVLFGKEKVPFGCPPAKWFCRDGPQPPVPLEWQ